MSLFTYLLGIVAAGLALFIVIEMLRRRSLRERHAIWWLIAGIFALIVSVFPVTLEWTARQLGIAVPTNLVFFVSIAVLFFVCLQNSSELTSLEEKNRVLAEQSALLSIRVTKLEKIMNSQNPNI